MPPQPSSAPKAKEGVRIPPTAPAQKLAQVTARRMTKTAMAPPSVTRAVSARLAEYAPLPLEPRKKRDRTPTIAITPVVASHCQRADTGRADAR